MWDLQDPEGLEALLGHHFQDRGLLALALTHSSMRAPETPCNERMEFLGDSILGTIIAHHLFAALPDHEEGDLTRIRSAVVSRATIGRVCRDLGIAPHIGLGKGIQSRKHLPLSIYANVHESLVAAIFLDAGIEPARAFILATLGGALAEMSSQAFRWNYKSRLQDYAQKAHDTPPRYLLVAEEGPDHAKTFQVEAVVGGVPYPPAWGSSKKDAEQHAARIALEALIAAGLLGASAGDSSGPAGSTAAGAAAAE